jgi:hypothetical protein
VSVGCVISGIKSNDKDQPILGQNVDVKLTFHIFISWGQIFSADLGCFQLFSAAFSCLGDLAHEYCWKYTKLKPNTASSKVFTSRLIKLKFSSAIKMWSWSQNRHFPAELRCFRVQTLDSSWFNTRAGLNSELSVRDCSLFLFMCVDTATQNWRTQLKTVENCWKQLKTSQWKQLKTIKNSWKRAIIELYYD